MQARYEILTSVPGGTVELFALTRSSYDDSPSGVNRSSVGRFNTLQLAMHYCREAYQSRGVAIKWDGLPVSGKMVSTPAIDVSAQP